MEKCDGKSTLLFFLRNLGFVYYSVYGATSYPNATTAVTSTELLQVLTTLRGVLLRAPRPPQEARTLCQAFMMPLQRRFGNGVLCWRSP